MGITAALVFCNLGSAYGTAKAGVGIASVGVLKTELVFKSLIPIIMAGILGIYGLIVSVILQSRGKNINKQFLTFFIVVQTPLSLIPPSCTAASPYYAAPQWSYSAYNGYRHLASGLCCGLSSLAAGLAIGVAGDAGVRANA